MENASKALIIAGAILLSILIISLGIWIFTSAQQTVSDAGNMDEQTITAFNNKFTASLGKNVGGNEVNALIQTVRSNNQTACEDGSKEKIIAIYTNGTSLTGGTDSAIITSKTGSNVNSTGTVSTTTTGSGSTLKCSVTGSVATGSTYEVTCSYYNGIINAICIKAK